MQELCLATSGTLYMSDPLDEITLEGSSVSLGPTARHPSPNKAKTIYKYDTYIIPNT